MTRKPQTSVEFQVTGLFPGDISSMEPIVSYVDDSNKTHTFNFGAGEWGKIYKRLRNTYGYVSDLRSRPENFRISFTVNQKDSFVVKLVDKSSKKRFTLYGSTYEGVGEIAPYFFDRISKKDANVWMDQWGHVWREMYRGTDSYQDILFGKKR